MQRKQETTTHEEEENKLLKLALQLGEQLSQFIWGYPSLGLPWWLSGKESACNTGDVDLLIYICPGREDPLKEGVATHSHVLALRIPWTEEPRGLQSIELQSQTRLK